MDEWAEILKLKPCPFCGEIPSVRRFEQERFGGKRLVLECCMTHEITQAAPETSNIFSRGAEQAKHMMQEILEEVEEYPDADGPETLPG